MTGLFGVAVQLTWTTTVCALRGSCTIQTAVSVAATLSQLL